MTEVRRAPYVGAGTAPELGFVTSSLQRLGQDVPEEVPTELDALDGASVDVVIRCLLCGAFGTYPAAVDCDGMPRAAICSTCDRAVFDEGTDETGN